MKTKLSPIEELRQQKLQLKRECTEKEEQLTEKIVFVKDNLGSLFVNSVFSSSVSKIQSFLPFSSEGNPSSYFSSMLTVGQRVLPIAWTLIQPILIRTATRKVKELIFGKKKKTKKQHNEKTLIK